MKNLIDLINKKYFNIDTAYLFGNSFYVLLSYVTSFISTFLVTYIVANSFSEHSVGIFRYISSWYGILSVFALGGMSTALMIATAKGEAVLQKALYYKALSTILPFSIAFLAGLYYLFNSNPELGINFIILSFSFILLETSTIYSAYLQGLHKFKEASFFQIISKIFYLIGLIIFVYLFSIKSSYILVILNFIIIGLIQICYALYLHRKIDSPKSDSGTVIKPLFLKTTVHLTLMGIIFSFGQQVDKLILFKFFGTTALAAYWIASTLPQEALRVLNQLFSIYIPKLSQKKTFNRETKIKVMKIVLGLFILLLFCLILYWLLAPFIFKLLFTKYYSSVALTQILFISVIFSPFIFLWTFFITNYDFKNTYLYHFIDPIINILCLFVFVYILEYSLYGVAYAFVVKNMCMAILGTYLFLRYTKTR